MAQKKEMCTYRLWLSGVWHHNQKRIGGTNYLLFSIHTACLFLSPTSTGMGDINFGMLVCQSVCPSHFGFRAITFLDIIRLLQNVIYTCISSPLKLSSEANMIPAYLQVFNEVAGIWLVGWFPCDNFTKDHLLATRFSLHIHCRNTQAEFDRQYDPCIFTHF